MLKRAVKLLRTNISNNGGRSSSSFTYFAEKTPENRGSYGLHKFQSTWG